MINCSCGGAGCKICKAQTSSLNIWLPVEPMGAVRTTQKQKHVDARAQRYASYKQEIQLHAMSHITGPPTPGLMAIKEIKFYMPMPKSGKTSYKDPVTGKRKQRKVEPGEPHDKKPDIDNLIKGLFDALNGIVWVDDAQVYKIGKVTKVWGDEPGIEFDIDL